ncbi:MAG: PaaI family thioesterase [Deltaproteobacteria bacterium]|nr:PaaI family thioesterase [Deltaproteobacteria bacterium]
MTETPFANLKKLPNTDTHNCFACSPANAAGLQMTFFTDEERVYSHIAVPEHMGSWHRIVHGGILATILDETMGWAGIYLLEQLTLTKTMTVNFDKAAVVGETLHAEGWVEKRIGKREAVIRATIANAGNETCADAKGVFTMLSLPLAKRIGLMGDEFEATFFAPLMRSKREV